MSYFYFVPLRSFNLCNLGEALEGPISTRVRKISIMLIKKTTYKYETITILKIDSTVDIHRNILLSKHFDQSPYKRKKAAE